ncbi:hypothetical protein HRI_001130600 [Hibiscus trionum]|uniref:Uncharacterized protein n=1 Tax=Hibiscus trionum TaxID=183268 RepID=A0A9W7LS00_HIBTR|nr:hypothetical protein HRI_001130600 [Hibiscus trionum]
MFPTQPKLIENSVHMTKPIADQENLSMSKLVADDSKMFPEPKVRNLVVLAVHKVISDTGLVLISPGSSQKIDRPSLPYDWSSSSPVILCYSLPQLLSIGHALQENAFVVTLKIVTKSVKFSH